jgi:hypothetical protein
MDLISKENDNLIGEGVQTVIDLGKKVFATNLTPPTGYTLVAMEDETVTFPGLVDVAFGANGKFLYKKGVTGAVTFSRTFFGGDPIKKKKKGGFAKAVEEEVKALVSTPASGDKPVAEVDVKTGTEKTLKDYLPLIIGIGLVILLISYFKK